MDIAELRRLYPKFIYQNYQLEEEAGRIRIRYAFSIPGLSDFCPSWELPRPLVPALDLTSPQGRAFLFSLGMIELLSYWKCACPPIIELRCGSLDEAQQRFWRTLYLGGLGEFLHLNRIEIAGEKLFSFENAASPESDCNAWRPELMRDGTERAPLAERSLLIPVGGGKDSVVTLERLRPLGSRRFAYAVNPTQAALDCMKEAGIPEKQRILLRRCLDLRLLELNARGFLNGHTPFSALLAFSAVLTAKLYGLDDIVLSNEASADEATVIASEVNHQYSKSSAFEQDFAAYLQRYLAPELRYFSLLRPFSELAIAREFARYPAYFPLFKSCNVGSKTQSWCGRCAKCLFVAAVLLPFAGIKTLHDLLGRDIFDDLALAPLLDGLCGLASEKPFECVGTVEELNLALVMFINGVLEKSEAAGLEQLPALLRRYAERVKRGEVPAVRWQDGRLHISMGADHPLTQRYPAQLLPVEYEVYLRDFLLAPQREQHWA